MLIKSNDIVFSKEQIEYLSSLHFINRIDDHLKSVNNVNIVEISDTIPVRVILSLDIYYDDNKIDILTFDLHNYNYDDIIEIAKDIRSSEFIMQEVDNFLSGSIE
jgi:hypothetical protein